MAPAWHVGSAAIPALEAAPRVLRLDQPRPQQRRGDNRHSQAAQGLLVIPLRGLPRFARLGDLIGA